MARLGDRAWWGLLGAAMVASAGLILWLNRATTFSIDQYDFVEDSPGFTPGDALEPHNGHLVAVMRLAYWALLETFGTASLPFRILGVIALLLAVGALFALLRRHVGAAVAFAPAVVLLFFGSAWHHSVVPVGFANLLSIAGGLGALVALERRSRGGDLTACGLAVVSLASFSTGLAFLAGIAASVLVRGDRLRRAWVFAVPVALYGAWWIYALSIETPAAPETRLSNILLAPAYTADSLAASLAALTGLNYDWASPVHGRELGWGRVLAVVAVAALAIRIWRAGLSPFLIATLAIALVYWSLLSLSFDPLVRPPGALRYLYGGSIAVILVAAAAVGATRISGRGLAIVYAVAAFSLLTNVALLREGAAHFREDYSARAMAQFTALELARGHVDPGFDPAAAVPPDVSPVSAPAGVYFDVVDSYGSPAFAPGELERQPERIRAVADRILAAAVGLGLVEEPAPRACRTVGGEGEDSPVRVELPQDGAAIEPVGAAATVRAGRFAAAPPVELGELGAGDTAAVHPPPDPGPQPWYLSVEGPRSVRVCTR